MIKMKSGVYGAKNILKRPGDGPFCLSDEEEARLVKRGVAEYVYEPQPAVNDESPILPHYDIGMTEKQLRGIAAYFLVDVSAAKRKQDIIDALDNYFSEADAEESPSGAVQGDDGAQNEDEEGSGSGAPNPDADDSDAPALSAETPTK